MRPPKRTASFWLLAALTLLLLLIVLSPFALVVAGAVLNTSFLGMSTEQWASNAGRALFSFHWFGYVWELYHGSFYFSLRLSLLSTLLGLVIGVPGGFALVRSNFPGAGALEAFVMLPLAMPGIALSIALIQAYAVIRGSWWLILCGHLLYTLPFMVRLVTDALRSFDAAGLEVCAQGLGANFRQRFVLVILPNLRHAMTSGALMVFAVSWGEFNVSFLLNTPLNQTYPAALYATYTSNSFQVGSAATVIFLMVSIPALLAIQWLGGKSHSNIEKLA
jgi:putative spermidine/putrescine transport system permease protein